MIKIFALMRNILINEKEIAVVEEMIYSYIFKMGHNYMCISCFGTKFA